jgi:cytochrome c oxidase subunit 1
MTGRSLNQRLGKVHFWLMFVSFNSTFLPLFIAGIEGMPRRVVTYPSRFDLLNAWSSISAFVLGLSMLLFVGNVIYSLLISPKPADENPWASKSLEWATTTPPPPQNFEGVPVIAPLYDYGIPVAETQPA